MLGLHSVLPVARDEKPHIFLRSWSSPALQHKRLITPSAQYDPLLQSRPITKHPSKGIFSGSTCKNIRSGLSVILQHSDQAVRLSPCASIISLSSIPVSSWLLPASSATPQEDSLSLCASSISSSILLLNETSISCQSLPDSQYLQSDVLQTTNELLPQTSHILQATLKDSELILTDEVPIVSSNGQRSSTIRVNRSWLSPIPQQSDHEESCEEGQDEWQGSPKYKEENVEGVTCKAAEDADVHTPDIPGKEDFVQFNNGQKDADACTKADVREIKEVLQPLNGKDDTDVRAQVNLIPESIKPASDACKSTDVSSIRMCTGEETQRRRSILKEMNSYLQLTVILLSSSLIKEIYLVKWIILCVVCTINPSPITQTGHEDSINEPYSAKVIVLKDHHGKDNQIDITLLKSDLDPG